MKALMHYAPMVGVPLLGVAFALRVGTQLEAPPSVGGDWKVVAGDDIGPTCTPAGALGTLREIKIAQSGGALTLVLRGESGAIAMTGTVGARPDSAARQASRGIQVVATQGDMRLTGEAFRDSVPALLSVRLLDPACGGGPGRQILARRVAAAGARPGAH